MNQRKRILFVDDEPNVLHGLRRMMRTKRSEWKMEFIGNACDALNVMRDTHYDMVVSDLCMPDMDGVELLETVRKRHPSMKRFMLTGCGDQPIQQRAVMIAHQLVAKPCDGKHLMNLIARAFMLNDRIRSRKAAKVVSGLRSLPAMPKIHQKVIDALGMPACSARRIGRIITGDIGMSAKILQVVNSAYYGNRYKIADPIRAVVNLGLRTVEALILTQGVFSKLTEEKVVEFSVGGLQEHCVRVGVLAKSICKAEGLSEDELEVATMAGILHDAGKMILISEFPDQFREAIQLSRQQQIPLYAAERRILDMTHCELGACLLELWGLPNAIIEAASFHHEPELFFAEEFTIFTAVYAANVIDHQLCNSLGDGWAEGVNVSYLEEIGVIDRWKKWQRLHLPEMSEEYEYAY